MEDGEGGSGCSLCCLGKLDRTEGSADTVCMDIGRCP